MDNSVEAKAAHIDVMVTVGKARKTGKKKATDKITEIAVVDDGCGMNKGTLHRCLALGESIRAHGGKLGIGRFGVGMTLGGISLARRIEVYSRTNANEAFLYTFIDLDDIQKGNLIRIPEPVVQTPPENLAGILENSSGTIVILKDCDRIEGNVDFSNYLGQTYRKFIERGLEIRLNGERVYLHDPMYMASPTIFDEQRLRTEGAIEPKATSLGEFHLAREIPGSDGKTADVVIRMSLLPEEWRSSMGAGGSVEAKKRKIDRNEGISILRADREVFYGHVPYITGKKGEARALEIDLWKFILVAIIALHTLGCMIITLGGNRLKCFFYCGRRNIGGRISGAGRNTLLQPLIKRFRSSLGDTRHDQIENIKTYTTAVQVLVNIDRSCALRLFQRNLTQIDLADAGFQVRKHLGCPCICLDLKHLCKFF